MGTDDMLEFTIRAQHDPEFQLFAKRFGSARRDEERLAVLWLFQKSEFPCGLEELAAALEYVFNYDGLLPANIACMRFFAFLQRFSQASAAAFARALIVVPKLDPAQVFRSVAAVFMIGREHSKLSTQACITYFNEASLIEGMQAFAVQRFVCIRRNEAVFSSTYAEAVVDEGEFIRFVLGIYTDCRLQAVDMLLKHCARSTLCFKLIRTYLAHQDADEPKLMAEILATVRGRPIFEPVQRFLVTAGNDKVDRQPQFVRPRRREELPAAKPTPGSVAVPGAEP
jgi:hypothetical protein